MGRNLNKRRPQFSFWILFLLLLSSCADFGDIKYRTWIDFPQQGNQFYLGDTVPITAHYFAEDGADNIVIQVNDLSVLDTPSSNETKPIAKLIYDWIPDQAGKHNIRVSVFSEDKALLSSAQVEVIILKEEEVQEEEEMPEEEEKAEGSFNQNGFCRSGPGMNYPAIAVFEQGYRVALEARTESLSPLWFYVLDPFAELFCWASSSVIETEINPESLTAIQAPPVPVTGGEGGSGETACHQDMNAMECIASGGTWYSPIEILTDPYCICP